MPMGLARPTGMISKIPTGHHIANTRLLIPIIIVITNENGAITINRRHVIVTKIMGDKLKVVTIEIATPNGSCPEIRSIGSPFFTLSICRLEISDPCVAYGKIQFAIRPNRNTMHAMIMIEALKTRK